jgi:hypothetical protein
MKGMQPVTSGSSAVRSGFGTIPQCSIVAFFNRVIVGEFTAEPDRENHPLHPHLSRFIRLKNLTTQAGIDPRIARRD